MKMSSSERRLSMRRPLSSGMTVSALVRTPGITVPSGSRRPRTGPPLNPAEASRLGDPCKYAAQPAARSSRPAAGPVDEPLEAPADPVKAAPAGHTGGRVAREPAPDLDHRPPIRQAHLREEEADQRIGVGAGDDRGREIDHVGLPSGPTR